MAGYCSPGAGDGEEKDEVKNIGEKKMRGDWRKPLGQPTVTYNFNL